MTKAAKVVWTEGMFLRPHHFQQSERYLSGLIRDWGMAQRCWAWGFFHLEFDQEMLRLGSVALNGASGILPDGTPFAFGNGQQAPAPLTIADNQTGQKVLLALPARRGDREEVIFSPAADSLARWLSYEAEIDDYNEVSIGPAVVQFGQLRLRLMLESELSAEWTAIGIGKVAGKNNTNGLLLERYVPPMLNMKAHTRLLEFLNDVQALLTERSVDFGNRIQQPGRLNRADFADFMLLALVNRHIGLLAHLRELPQLHPETLFCHWLSLATELKSYLPQRICEAERLPVYLHQDLEACFSELILLLRQGLSIVIEENATQLRLEDRSHGLNVATVPDANMIRECNFVLAVKADVPDEMLLANFPAQMKVAPVAKIRDLVQLQLPGITLHAMPAVPPQIPWHAGYSYFRLEKGGELWDGMAHSGAFALHLAGEFPGLEMAFWAVRDVSA
ncbi:type VI secretion system baseplate subunit TssK [Kalamiella sp. sgz302252]|uniref:type VI secretion system baseplate subunit TssK n=1 Tax=Pantoea sp. sgz302252 TaxID=3341827 RepID=UPI0036D34F0F